MSARITNIDKSCFDHDTDIDGKSQRLSNTPYMLREYQILDTCYMRFTPDAGDARRRSSLEAFPRQMGPADLEPVAEERVIGERRALRAVLGQQLGVRHQRHVLHAVLYVLDACGHTDNLRNMHNGTDHGLLKHTLHVGVRKIQNNSGIGLEMSNSTGKSPNAEIRD